MPCGVRQGEGGLLEKRKRISEEGGEGAGRSGSIKRSLFLLVLEGHEWIVIHFEDIGFANR